MKNFLGIQNVINDKKGGETKPNLVNGFECLAQIKKIKNFSFRYFQHFPTFLNVKLIDWELPQF